MPQFKLNSATAPLDGDTFRDYIKQQNQTDPEVFAKAVEQAERYCRSSLPGKIEQTIAKIRDVKTDEAAELRCVTNQLPRLTNLKGRY